MDATNDSPWSRLVAPAVLSATLGLAPFTPEPHIVGKLRWLAGGAVGMGTMDWLELLMHGAPFVYLIVSVGVVLRAHMPRPARPEDSTP